MLIKSANNMKTVTTRYGTKIYLSKIIFNTDKSNNREFVMYHPIAKYKLYMNYINKITSKCSPFLSDITSIVFCTNILFYKNVIKESKQIRINKRVYYNEFRYTYQT